MIKNDRVLRTAVFIATAGLVAGTGHTGNGTFAHLPIQIDLKDRLSATPSAMATFFALVALPWNFKPLASVVADVLPVFGSRRRAYLVIGALGAALSWIALATAPRAFAGMIAIAFGIEICVMLSSAVLGAVLVEAGQEHRATGRLTSVRMTAIFLGSLVAGPVGGWLATRPLAWTAAVGIALQVALLAVTLTCVEETRTARSEGLREAVTRLFSIFRSRELVVSAALGFLVLTAPGFGTPLLYRQTEELGHSPQFVGMTRFGSMLAAGAVAVVYGFACRRFRLRTLLVSGIVAHALSALLFLFLKAPDASAIAIFSIYGGCTALVLLCLWDLSARVAPKRYEGLAYALMMSALNLAQSASDVGGSFLHDRFGVDFPKLVWLNTATTLAVLLVLPLLPRAFLDRPDRQDESTSNAR